MERTFRKVTVLCFLSVVVTHSASAVEQNLPMRAAPSHHGHHGMFFDQDQARESREQSAASTFERIQNEVFTQSCALQSCHGSNAKSGGLVLELGSSYNALVNTTPANSVASGAGKKRVFPGDLDRSFLWNKISAHLVSGEGAPMPLGSNGFINLNPELTEVIRKWILAGAPKEGFVEGTGGSGSSSSQQQPPLEPLAPPAVGQGFQVNIPAFALSNQPEREGCLFVRLPNTEPIYMSGYEIHLRPGSHHFIVYSYNGEACDRDSDNDGTPNCLDQDSGEAFPPQFTDDIGCNDKGPRDSFQKSFIAGSQTPSSTVAYPPGIALKLEPHHGLLLNAHYINYYQNTQGEVLLNINTVPANTVHYEAKIIFDVIANSFIAVPPQAVKESRWAWSPSKRSAILGLTSHMHKRGTRFTIDHLGGDGSDKNPADGPMDDQGKRHLYVNTDYADPANLRFASPLILEPGEQLSYTCQHDNGVSRSIKMGCEESAGVVPGRALEAARRCQSDADCAGFGTGRCVPANLVFGYTSDDEMCIMPGVYYELEADTGGGGTSSFALMQVTHSADNPATAFAEESFTTSLSGDGTRLAFTSSADLVGQNADGSLEVFTADLSTAPPTIRQLTSASGGTLTSAFPVISNDGTTVAFTSNADLLRNGTNSDGNPEVFAANFDGGNLRQLTNTPTGTNGPFLSNAGELLNLLGLTINGNGSVVAFTSTAPLGGRSNASQEVFILGTNGSGLRQLTSGTVGNSANPNLAINGVSITEDGSRIAFSSTGDYVNNNGFQIPQIFTIASDGSGLRQLTAFSQGSCEESGGTLCVGTFVTPTFSDDGSRIGFLRLLVNLDNLTSPKLLNTEPFIMNADGTGRQQLFDAPSAQVNCSPVALSRNGSQAAFVCTDDATKQGKLYVNSAGGGALQIVTDPFPNTGLTAPPALSDAGSTVAFVAKANPVGQNDDKNAEVFIAAQGGGGTATALENPRPGSTQSGIGIISGWACRANHIDFVIDGIHQLQAVYGTGREDTRSVCNDADNGFSLLVNWNLLANGIHTLQARADGVEFARVTFTVSNLGAEFLKGLSGECTVPSFPKAGTSTAVHWDESLQNFVLGPNQSSGGSAGVSGNTTAKLENPAGGSTQSGINVVSGWTCQAGKVEFVIDGTIRLLADYGSGREDTRPICNDTNNGFALLVNWNLLSQGGHTLAVVIDGTEVAKVPFTVTNLGTEFLTGVSGECSVANFPQSGKTTKVRWDEGIQRFGIVGVE